MRRLPAACPPVLLPLLLLLLLPWPAPAEPFRFAAFGDMPYCDPRAGAAACAAEEARVTALVGTINAARPAFTLFVGDTKGGAEDCTDAIVFDRTRAWMGGIAGALIYTPGDNEWTDCWQARAGRHDPIALLARLRQGFFAAPRSLGQAPLPLTRQADAQPGFGAYVENARWVHEGVLFVTAHIPGSDNNRPPEGGDQPPGAAEEYPARNAANLAWLADSFALAARQGLRAVVVGIQADMWYRDRCGRGAYLGHVDSRAALVAGARAFGGAVLVVHGDSHFWLHDRPEPGAPNLERIMVPGAQDTRAVVVEVDPAAPAPFRFGLIGPADRAAAPNCG